MCYEKISVFWPRMHVNQKCLNFLQWRPINQTWSWPSYLPIIRPTLARRRYLKAHRSQEAALLFSPSSRAHQRSWWREDQLGIWHKHTHTHTFLFVLRFKCAIKKLWYYHPFMALCESYCLCASVSITKETYPSIKEKEKNLIHSMSWSTLAPSLGLQEKNEWKKLNENST